MCRARATWARSRTNSAAIDTFPTRRPAPCSSRCGACTLEPEPGLRIPNMFEAALDGSFKGTVHPGRGHGAVRSQYAARHGGTLGDGMRGRAGSVSQRDGEVRARIPAGLVVPRKGRHVHQCRASHLARAQGDAAARRPGGLGSHRASRECARLPDALPAPFGNHGRNRRAHADVHRRELRKARSARQHPVAVQRSRHRMAR